jgi:hypothetical protein
MATTSRLLILWLAFHTLAAAQIRYTSGQNVVPVYEGWERNPDGSFNMVFGYMNRNYGEEVEIPIGPANKIEPGEADQKQPSHFYPRRQEFVFKVKVPADWGDKDVVWTLTSRDKTQRAFGSLMPVWELGNLVYLENRRGAAALTYPEQPDKAPLIEMVGPAQTTIAVGDPVTLSVQVTDDGYPKPVVRPQNAGSKVRAATSNFKTQSPASQAVVKLDPGVRLGVTWVVYRGGPGSAHFEEMRIPVTKVSDMSTAPDGPLTGHATTKVSFDKPGTYVLRGYADDGILTSSLDVTVTVEDKIEHARQ